MVDVYFKIIKDVARMKIVVIRRIVAFYVIRILVVNIYNWIIDYLSIILI